MKLIMLSLIAFASAFALYAVTYTEAKTVIVTPAPHQTTQPLHGQVPLQTNVETNSDLSGLQLQ